MTYRLELIFLHVVGAVVWVGGMIAMRFAAHPAFMEIGDPKERLPKIAKGLKRLFMLVLPFVMILAATGTVLTIGYGIKHTDFSYLTHIKEIERSKHIFQKRIMPILRLVIISVTHTSVMYLPCPK